MKMLSNDIGLQVGKKKQPKKIFNKNKLTPKSGHFKLKFINTSTGEKRGILIQFYYCNCIKIHFTS